MGATVGQALPSQGNFSALHPWHHPNTLPAWTKGPKLRR